MEASTPKLPTEKKYFYRSERGSHASTCRNLTCYSKCKKNAGEDTHTKNERLRGFNTIHHNYRKMRVPFQECAPSGHTHIQCLRTLSRKWDGWLPTEASMILIQQTFMKHLLCPTVCMYIHVYVHICTWESLRLGEWGGEGRRGKEGGGRREGENEKHRRSTKERKPVVGMYPIPWELTQRTEMEGRPTHRWLITQGIRSLLTCYQLLPPPALLPCGCIVYNWEAQYGMRHLARYSTGN